jgi:uncharacterized membrane protein
MGTIAALGTAETAYLTYIEVTGSTERLFCPTEGGCSSVLTGPYAMIPGTEVPLAALGFLAYSTVLGLSLWPLFKKSDDQFNRVALTAVTTTMAVFSAYLMLLLLGILHENCPYCIASAIFSFLLAKICWAGDALPKESTRQGILVSAGGAVLSTLAALFFVTSFQPPSSNPMSLAGTLFGSSSTLLADNKVRAPQSPPPITTESSMQALKLANDLENLNTRFFGAFWCGHCYEQKQILGREAMNKIPYIECSRDGLNSQANLYVSGCIPFPLHKFPYLTHSFCCRCKERKVPGYPTWEINGELYPGEQSIEELQEVVDKVKASLILK